MTIGIRANLNKFTPGMSFGHFAKKVLYKGVGCGYIEVVGKRKYVLTPVLEKLEHKMDLNDFSPHYPKIIGIGDLNMLKMLLRPLIRNEKGFKKLNTSNYRGGSKTFQYSPSPAASVVWDKETREPVITIVKELKHPTREIFFHRFSCLRKIWRINPNKEI